MDEQRIENIIQFLTENQARFHTDLELLKENLVHLKERIYEVTENQARTDVQLQALAEQTDARIQALIEEMHDGFNNLLIANEVTRDLATKVGQLTM